MSNRKKGIIATAGILGAVAGLSLLERIASNHTESSATPTNNSYVAPQYSRRELTNNINREFPKIREGPVYDDSRVPANNCSRYVRLAAKDLFGIEYPADDAWNLRNYKDKVQTIPVDSEALRNFASQEQIRSGDIVAFYNPASKYNTRPAAKKAGYTHVMLYLGEENKELYFADKFGKKTRTKVGLNELKNSGLKPVELIIKKN